mmetsp:Transcript_22156/g.71596  ORF Transcript_22156/g.71596 Transcript_22156/m.71596 type:complete len:200 (+) Transcript_22156:202-801(+)|eukprot:scaffold830_cov112-Isochrysis_galbana.AAC.4
MGRQTAAGQPPATTQRTAWQPAISLEKTHGGRRAWVAPTRPPARSQRPCGASSARTSPAQGLSTIPRHRQSASAKIAAALNSRSLGALLSPRPERDRMPVMIAIMAACCATAAPSRRCGSTTLARPDRPRIGRGLKAVMPPIACTANRMSVAKPTYEWALWKWTAQPLAFCAAAPSSWTSHMSATPMMPTTIAASMSTA